MSVRARDSIALFSTVEIYQHLAANYITAQQIEAQYVKTTNLEANYATINELHSNYITATEIQSQYVTTGTLTANYITASDIATTYLTAADARVIYADIDTLTADEARITSLESNAIRTDTLNAAVANLGYVTATQVAAGYADIGLANVQLISGEAFIVQDSVTNNAIINAAYIKDLTADSLRLRGKDGLYYAINVDQGEVTTAQADADLNTYGAFVTGKSILDQTIVANKLYVDDLYAIKGQFSTAKIAGLTLESGSIHSDNVTSINDTDTGFYLNSVGELLLKGTNAALKFFIDTNDSNKRKLSITADSIYIGSNNVGTTLDNIGTSITNISTQVSASITKTTQLWYANSSTTAPDAPTSKITSTSTSGGAWRAVVPVYAAANPYYFYCFQYEYNDGTCGWSSVVRNTALETALSQSTSAYANGIKKTTQLWYESDSTTAPAAPTSKVTSTADSAGGWRVTIPQRRNATPYYYYCFQYEYNNDTVGWSDVVFDNTSELNRVKHTAPITLDPVSTGYPGIYVGTSSGYRIAAANVSFDVNYPHLFVATTETGLSSTNEVYDSLTNNLSLRYNKGDISLTPNKMAYLVGTISGNTFTIDSAIFANAPTGVNNKYYIPVGLLSDEYHISYSSSKEIYKYDELKGFCLLQNAAVVKRETQYGLSKADDKIGAISSITYTYARSANLTEPSSITSTSIPTVNNSYPYLWQKETVAYTDTSLANSVTVRNIWNYKDKLESVSSIAYTYKSTANDTIPSASSITGTSVPSSANHLWQKEIITDSGGTSKTTIKQIYVNWTTSIPTVTKDGYLWTREKTYYAVGDALFTTPVCITNYTSEIMQPSLENVKEYSYTQAAGLVTTEVSAALEAVSNTYVRTSDYNSYVSTTNTRIAALPTMGLISTIQTSISNITSDIDGLQSYKQTQEQHFAFTPDGLIISNVDPNSTAYASAVKSVLTNSAWQIRVGSQVVQQIDAQNGAQFSSITIKALSGAKGKLVLGSLTLEVQDDNTLIGSSNAS